MRGPSPGKQVIPDAHEGLKAAIRRLVGAILLGQTDEWAVQRARCMTLESVASASLSTPRDTTRPCSGTADPPCSARPVFARPGSGMRFAARHAIARVAGECGSDRTTAAPIRQVLRVTVARAPVHAVAADRVTAAG